MEESRVDKEVVHFPDLLCPSLPWESSLNALE